MIDIFIRLAKLHGATVSVVKGGGVEACAANTKTRVIFLGSRLKNADVAAIVGLHELGHIATLNNKGIYHLLGPRTPQAVYAVELMAWVWAEQHVPLEHKALFEEIKTSTMETYFYEVK